MIKYEKIKRLQKNLNKNEWTGSGPKKWAEEANSLEMSKIFFLTKT